MASLVFPIARGISLGGGITDMKRIEDSVRAGRNALFMSITQASQVHFASTMASEALLAAGLNEVPFEGRMIGYLAPVVIAYFIKGGIDSPCVRKCAIFIQNSIGILCQLAALVSVIAMIALGHLAFGITAAAIIAIGFLDRMGALPDVISHFIHNYSPLIRGTMGLIVGGIVEKIFAVISLVTICYQKYISCTEKQEVREALITQKETLDLPLLEKIIARTVELEVNPHHLQIPLLPPSPNVDIQSLVDLFETIDWHSQIAVVRAKFKDDLRFKELYGNVDEYNEATLIKLLKTNLQKFIDDATNRHVDGGVIHEFTRLQDYLKTVAYQLPKENKITQVDVLVRLAVEGGGYCGPEKLHLGEELYCQLAQNSDIISPETKILLRLQDLRTNWFNKEYDESNVKSKNDDGCLLKFLKWIVDFQDLHLYNLFVNTHGQKLGIRKSSSDNDYAAAVDPLTKLYMANETQKILDDFDKIYTRSYIEEQLQDGAGTSTVPIPDLYSWWQSWVERQEIDQERKNEILNGITAVRPQILNLPMQPRPPAGEIPEHLLGALPFNITLLKAMALDIGILKIKTA